MQAVRRQQHLLGEPRPDQRSQRLRHLLRERRTRSTLRNNLFYGNGTSETDQANATNDLGNGFNPALLGTTAAAAQSQPGELRRQPGLRLPDRPQARLGWSRELLHRRRLPVDRRVGGDRQRLGSRRRSRPTSWATPRSRSAAAASVLPGYGPRDVGAFEFDGTGGQADRRLPSGSSPPRSYPSAARRFADGATDTVTSSPTVDHRHLLGQRQSVETSRRPTWSSPDRPSTRPAPVHATSLTWIDAHTVEFNLAGQFNSAGNARRRDRAQRDPEHDGGNQSRLLR